MEVRERTREGLNGGLEVGSQERKGRKSDSWTIWPVSML